MVSRLHENPVAWRARKRRRRQFVVGALGSKCCVCGAMERLELDHVQGDGYADHPRGAGTNNVAAAIRAFRVGVLHQRFQLLCANDHRAKTATERASRAKWNG